MGLFDKIKGEFIDIVEWIDDTNDTLVYRFERYGNEIKNGAKLVVREAQKAVFINKGQIADIFDPGMYTLATENLPILSTIMGWKYGFNSPFKAEVYFINTRIFTDLKWGTPSPIMLRDPEFGPMRIRARGNYTIQVKDPSAFIKGIVGTDGNFTEEEISNHLRNMIITLFTDMIGELKIPALDLAANYNEISAKMLEFAKKEFEKYGITADKVLVENITLPEEVEKAIDARSSMGIIGNMNTYTQYQAASSIKDFAQNEGGGGTMAAGGMGMGMGMAMGNSMSNSLNNQNPQQNQQGSPGTPPPPPTEKYYAYVNGQQTGPMSVQELQGMIQNNQVNKETLLWKPGMEKWEKASTFNEFTGSFGQMPPPPPVG